MTQIFNLELAQQLINSQDQFPVNFNNAWSWLDYSTKGNAKRYLIENFKEGIDFIISDKPTTIGIQARPEQTILLTIECFKMWGMMAGTAKGKEIRFYFLECEKRSKKELSRLEILEIALASEKENLLLKSKIEAANQLLITQEKVITKQAVQNLELEEAKSQIEKEKTILIEKVEKDAPLVDLAKKIEFTQGCVDFNTYAKIIGTGRVRLFKKMREAGVILQNSSMPYQKFIDAGFFEASEKIVQGERADGTCYDYIYPFAVVTGKGQLWLYQKLQSLVDSEKVEEFSI